MELCKYLHGENLKKASMGLHDLLYASPKLIADHCRNVAIEAGATVAAMIRSWFPGVDLSIVAEGFHPDTTDEQYEELLNSSKGAAHAMTEGISVEPRPFEIDTNAPRVMVNPATLESLRLRIGVDELAADDDNPAGASSSAPRQD